MAKDTPSMAKNKMRRSLLAIVDPHPCRTEIDLLWSYFQSCCAYCGVTIPRNSRTGHVDHVVSSALGGSNCIYNHVLSCARCNGDEKREVPWESFLARKVSDRELFAERHARISTWLSRSPGPSIPPIVRAQIDAIIDQAIGNFDSAVQELRALRRVEPNDAFRPKPLCGSD